MFHRLVVAMARRGAGGRRITGLAVSDVRFPTSLAHHGSDAMVRRVCAVLAKRQQRRLLRIPWLGLGGVPVGTGATFTYVQDPRSESTSGRGQENRAAAPRVSLRRFPPAKRSRARLKCVELLEVS